MNNALAGLQPASVWAHFYDLCQIPRPSKKEEKVIAYLEAFAQKHALSYKKDAVGNVVISKPATAGHENKVKTVLQSHVDMVCEKNTGTLHDFEKDPIIPRIENGWVKATGTTLGADNGLGAAAALAILAANDLQHGPIEALFTIDEETGLTGAASLQPGFLTGSIMINLDSENIDEALIGCAGGVDTVTTIPLQFVSSSADFQFFKINVSGLTGGHSGVDIHLGLQNANKILAEILAVGIQNGMKIAALFGGSARNAIPREAHAIVAIAAAQSQTWKNRVEAIAEKWVQNAQATDSQTSISITATEAMDVVIEDTLASAIVQSLVQCPHGVIGMSASIPGLVETSTNLATLRIEGQNLIIGTSQRSSIEKEKHTIAAAVKQNFAAVTGASVVQNDGYPGWKPNIDSPILVVFREVYARVMGKEAHVTAIHAGLECGLIGEKYPDLDMISFGPTIQGAHSPDERCHIDSVAQFWAVLLEMLKNMPAA